MKSSTIFIVLILKLYIYMFFFFIIIICLFIYNVHLVILTIIKEYNLMYFKYDVSSPVLTFLFWEQRGWKFLIVINQNCSCTLMDVH